MIAQAAADRNTGLRQGSHAKNYGDFAADPVQRLEYPVGQGAALESCRIDDLSFDYE